MGFFFEFICIVDYIDSFPYNEPSLHPRDKGPPHKSRYSESNERAHRKSQTPEKQEAPKEDDIR